MADDTKTDTKTTPPKAAVLFQIEAPLGQVIHPYTLTKFGGKAVSHELDEWTKAQVDIGLLKIV